MTRKTTLLFLTALVSSVAHAQWLNYREPWLTALGERETQPGGSGAEGF
jgi:hypothetical protein